MVLVNTLTVEAINTALIALQRGQSIVVGGEKETTVNNITISNSGGSGGNGLDFTPQINALDKRVGLLEKAEEVLREENERQNERLEILEGLGISNFTFDEVTRELSIELENGDTYDTTITSESFSMGVDNGELIIKIGNNEQRIPLPSGVQSDWTQTDSTDPSFIKHKIPIWITQGSADDNMSPVDSVTDGEMRPVTSNAVYDKHYLTSADITNQVTVDNMQSVSSNAVATELGNYRKGRIAQFYWANTYSSGYIRFIFFNGGGYNGNHDCSVAGIIRNCPPSVVSDFYFVLQCRGNGATVQHTRFSVFALNGGAKPSYVATYKVVNYQFNLTLYVPFASWKRDYAEILFVTGGDVFQPLDLQTNQLAFPMQWVSAIPSDETQITMT